VVTWALGTASGVLLGLFGVQLVSSRFSTSRVSPLSHPEVLRALQAARNVPVAEMQIAAPTPETTAPASTPSTDATPARPSAEAASPPASASPASTLPRPGAAAGPMVETASVPTTSSTTTTVTVPEPPSSSTTATTTKPDTDRSKSRSDKKSKNSTTTTTTRKTTPTTAPKPSSSSSRTKTVQSRGGVVTITWSPDGTVKGVARPRSGYEVRFVKNGPDKVEVWFWADGQASQVQAFSNGETRSTDWKCSSRPRFHCETV
jgi:hypothetical protein